MDTIILAGGLGTRLSEYTHSIPKPMVKIGNIPILHHIMNIYTKYNQKSFYIAMGYKSEEIIKYFIGESAYEKINKNELIQVKEYNNKYYNKGIEINLLHTGIDTMTGGRIKKIKDHISSEQFMVTYGDGLANINIKELLQFHKKNKKIGTVTAVRPPARFGELEIEDSSVINFEEKPQLQKGWINGGFFVFDKCFFDYIDSDATMLEREPLVNLTKQNELNAYKHEGFWQCMDSKRDHDLFQKMWREKNILWDI